MTDYHSFLIYDDLLLHNILLPVNRF